MARRGVGKWLHHLRARSASDFALLASPHPAPNPSIKAWDALVMGRFDTHAGIEGRPFESRLGEFVR